MSDTADVKRWIQDLRAAPGGEAFRKLSSAGPDALPEIMSAVRNEKDTTVRAKLIEALWRQPDPSLVPFLIEQLNDPNEIVWKEALNGLVTVANEDARKAVKAALKKLGRKGEPMRVEWYNEALEQIEEIKKENEENFLG
jgi:HEAT repeat protein